MSLIGWLRKAEDVSYVDDLPIQPHRSIETLPGLLLPYKSPSAPVVMYKASDRPL